MVRTITRLDELCREVSHTQVLVFPERFDGAAVCRDKDAGINVVVM